MPVDFSLQLQTQTFRKIVHESVHKPFKKRSPVNTFCHFFAKKYYFHFYKNLIKWKKMQLFWNFVKFNKQKQTVSLWTLSPNYLLELQCGTSKPNELIQQKSPVPNQHRTLLLILTIVDFKTDRGLILVRVARCPSFPLLQIWRQTPVTNVLSRLRYT